MNNPTTTIIIGIYMFFSRIDVSYLINPTPRIINGTSAYPGQFPFMVSLRYNKSHECCGTILSNKWILTAGHCMVNSDCRDWTVLYGSIKLNPEQDCENGIAKIEQIIIHEKYAKPFRNDISLIKLKEKLRMSNLVKCVQLNIRQEVIPEGSEGFAVGWGSEVANKVILPLELKYAKLNVISNDLCSKLYEAFYTINPSQQICAGILEGGKGCCFGDSGGPFLIDGYQEGIVSWGKSPCASPNEPTVFTRVSSYIEWIYKTTGLKKFKQYQQGKLKLKISINIG